jgi:hypothetical protein
MVPASSKINQSLLPTLCGCMGMRWVRFFRRNRPIGICHQPVGYFHGVRLTKDPSRSISVWIATFGSLRNGGIFVDSVVGDPLII